MRNLTLRIIKFLKIVCIVILAASCRKKSQTDNFSFAFITDIHLQPERNAVEGFLKAIDTINDLNPDFVITGGAVSGAWWTGTYRDDEEGFVLVKVRDSEFDWEFVDYKWEVVQ